MNQGAGNLQRVTARVPARAGLVGNPSDGYEGRVVSVAVDNFAAEVELTPWEGITITPADDDGPVWDSLDDLRRACDRYGHTGGIALIEATLAAYAEFVTHADIDRLQSGFRIAYRTSIPRQVGLAGSSAIAVAVLRAVIEHHGVVIRPELIPSLALAAEARLGITAGLQDRVVQTFGGVVSMDFRRRRMHSDHGLEYGEYRFLDPAGLPPLYLAWSSEAAGQSTSFHSDLRARFAAREWAVTSAMKMLSALAEQAEEAVRVGDGDALAGLIDQSFDVRNRIAELPAMQVEMVERARSTGASATFAGSGGAIVGTCRGIEQLNELQARLEPLGASVVRLTVAPEFAAM